MNPIYKFELTANGTTQRAFPVYKDDLAKDFEKESNQEFFRAKLSGKLTFQSDDYTFIVSQAFDTQFVLEIFISYNAGQSWASYWRGTFWKTDCEFDGDTKTVIVQPTVWDQYNDVLAGMDKEYNLIELAPEIMPVIADKRPMIQVYVPGQTVIACFLSGMWWEQECEAENDENRLARKGDGNLNFSLNRSVKVVEVTGPEDLPGMFSGTPFSETTPGITTYSSGGYKFSYSFQASAGGTTSQWAISRESDDVVMWSLTVNNRVPPSVPYGVTLTPVSGTGASGNVSLYIRNLNVYARYLLDVDKILGEQTYTLPTNDIVANNRNYRRVIGYGVEGVIWLSASLSSTPTKWGIYQPGQYYIAPYSPYFSEFFPIARQLWSKVSIWFCFSAADEYFERAGRAPFVLRDAYPLSSVISVLLAKIAPELTHEGTTDYSQFLYGANPLTAVNQTIMMTPKSNVVSAGYDQPAQRAEVTLRNVLEMLRDCYRCYWFVDAQNRFRIEHIQYFRNGGSYSGSPVVGIDLTIQKVSRNGKEWAFARNQYKFDKPEMAARYQFGWMDDVTQPFEGDPIDIISGFVNPDLIEDVTVNRFTSDVDYIMLNPSSVSKDGFVLLAAIKGARQAIEYSVRQATLNSSAAIGTSYEDMLDTSTTKRIATGLIRVDGPIQVLYSGGTHRYSVVGFDAEGRYNGIFSNWYTGNHTFANTSKSVYIAIVVAYQGNSDITPQGMPSDLYIMDDSLILPYFDYGETSLQNGYAAFAYLQRFYAYDMPAPLYAINGVQELALGVKKLKTQELSFPAREDPNLIKLIRTEIGDGVIEKISLNLSSRNASVTLRYDTEQ